ncbi:MAG TPA: DUF5666 domain-containing protein [Candidatus Paceibacterota bacterium]|nr:DUF5666 domain-containing protein [Candidatus Paceibacterota bacterium]
MKERIMRFGLPALAVITSIGVGFAGITSAQSAAAPVSGQNAQERPMGERPAVMGKVTAISGTTLTVERMARDASSTTSYSVDASSAKILKATAGSAPSEITIASVAVGDTVRIRGTLSGSSVAATEVVDGAGPGFGHGRGPGMGEGALGTVRAINGSTITLAGTDGQTYTVDASAATVRKTSTISVSDINIGDTIGVRGTISGTSVSAKDIMDGTPPALQEQ